MRRQTGLQRPGQQVTAVPLNTAKGLLRSQPLIQVSVYTTKALEGLKTHIRMGILTLSP